MPRRNRAKLFHPYDALKGFEETVHAKDTVYVPRTELTEYTQELLDRRLRTLRRGSRVTVTWFKAKSADCGQYISTSGIVNRIDPVRRTVCIDRQVIPFRDLFEIGFKETLNKSPRTS